jgi:hypothetical protein
MNAPTVRIERRVGQRFPYLLPVSFRNCSTGEEGRGFTQDLSSRGVFFFTNAALSEGATIELTVRMPSEITLGETMPVRCRGHVLRVLKPAANPLDPNSTPAESKIGVAARLESYEYLADSSSASLAIPRVASLHQHSVGDKPLA